MDLGSNGAEATSALGATMAGACAGVLRKSEQLPRLNNTTEITAERIILLK
jgi:hypothetical protein